MGTTFSASLNPIEITFLIVALILGQLPVAAFYEAAISKGWRSWYRLGDFKRPWFLISPILFMILWSIAEALISIGIFFFWREGERSEAFIAPPGPSDGVPDTQIWQAGVILWFSAQFMIWGVGALFWEFQAFLFCAIVMTLYVAAIIAVFGLSIVVWYVPAILIGIGALFALFALAVSWSMYAINSASVIPDGHTMAINTANARYREYTKTEKHIETPEGTYDHVDSTQQSASARRGNRRSSNYSRAKYAPDRRALPSRY